MKSRWPILVLAVCVAAFLFGMVKLFLMRFESGDVYPPYSSLRADPLGTMVFYESLERLPAIRVSRDFSDSNRLPDGRNAAYLHLAARSYELRWMPEEILKIVEAFVTRGGRLVITLHPEPGLQFGMFNPPASVGGSVTNKTAKQKLKKAPGAPRVSLKDRWGVDLGHVPLTPGRGGVYKPAQVKHRSDLDLPETLAWHSGTVFTNLQPAWRTIYERGARPVVIERDYGSGSIVMATDSYFLSNEALRETSEPRLLAWIIREADHIVFDEAHLGIVEHSGMSSLMRKYRLGGLLASLLLLAGLFIWKNSTSLVPPAAEDIAAGQVTGKDAVSGFVNLLRRNVPRRDILKACFEEWTRSLGRGGAHTIARVDQAQAIVEAEQARMPAYREPVRAYVEVCRILKPGPKRDEP